jgi:hypothetical protein
MGLYDHGFAIMYLKFLKVFKCFWCIVSHSFKSFVLLSVFCWLICYDMLITIHLRYWYDFHIVQLELFTSES